MLKKIIKRILGDKVFNLIKNADFRKRKQLKRNFRKDYELYKKHSSVFKKDQFNKIESEITLRYHSIEKGFLHNPIRYRFAKIRVEELINYLNSKEVVNRIGRAQIQSAILNLCTYYELHAENQIDISDFFDEKEYIRLKELLDVCSKPVINQSSSSYFDNIRSDFEKFSYSRCSVRNFTGEKIPIETINKVVTLANNAPTVCNRQGVSVNLLEDKKKIDAVLKIQAGLKGYSDQLSQIIVLTADRNYFYSVGERHQLYIDGGVYLLNLLYSLHFHGIAACPAHWGKPTEADDKAQKIIGLHESEKIICVVAIGRPTEEFKTTLSLRRSHEENLRIII